MVLTQPWVGVGVLLVALAVVLGAVWWPRRRARVESGLGLAAAASVRRLPRFVELARRRLRWSVLEAVSLAVALAGVALLAARPVDATTATSERSTRDIVLCLDVSGSMAVTDRAIIDAYADLAGRLDGERIGFAMFDTSSITVFPLTDDATFIQENLAAARDELDGTQVPGTHVGDVGSSLIGDGIAGCLQRFDLADTQRSRTVVLATDNQTAGQPLFTVQDAADRAVQQGVVVQAVVPSDNSVTATDDLAARLRPTGGKVFLLGPETDVSTLADEIGRGARVPLAGRPRSTGSDIIWPGGLLVAAGVVAAGVSARRRERR